MFFQTSYNKSAYSFLYGWKQLSATFTKYNDRAERHDFWSWFLPLILLFFFPLLYEGREKGKRITKVVVKNHAFLLDPLQNTKIQQKGMTFDNIFFCISPFLLPPFFMREEKKEKEWIKSCSKFMPFCLILYKIQYKNCFTHSR